RRAGLPRDPLAPGAPLRWRSGRVVRVSSPPDRGPNRATRRQHAAGAEERSERRGSPVRLPALPVDHRDRQLPPPAPDPLPAAAKARQLTRIDIAYFVSALAALATGVIRLFFYAKGIAFYLPNPAFQAKLALYVLVAVLSIRPTMRFVRWSRALDQGAGPPDA